MLSQRFSSMKSLSVLLNYDYEMFAADHLFEIVDVSVDFHHRTRQRVDRHGLLIPDEFPNRHPLSPKYFTRTAERIRQSTKGNTEEEVQKWKSISVNSVILTLKDNEIWAAEKLLLKAKHSKSRRPTRWALKPIERLQATFYVSESSNIMILGDKPLDYGLGDLFSGSQNTPYVGDGAKDEVDQPTSHGTKGEIFIALKADRGEPYWWKEGLAHEFFRWV
jgi:hypothetical protein